MAGLLKIVSSQYKHLPGHGPDGIDRRTVSRGSMLKNEMYSFQALYRAPEGTSCLAVSVSAETELPIGSWRVDYVPLTSAADPHGDAGYVSDQPGLYPDLLMPRPAAPEIVRQKTAWGHTFFEAETDSLLNAVPDFQSVWFTVNPDSSELEAGIYPIRINMTSLADGTILASETLTVEVIGTSLPEQMAYYTNWFHVDCLCDLFDTEPYSDTFYRIFDDYLRNMTRHRQNTLLLPAFTPPLDTPVGVERRNVQLVEIEKTGDGWTFGFGKMRQFLRHAADGGIRYFEHCHLFSQWGAKNAPNIYDRNGKRIFGYDTDASGEEYRTFLRAYLKAFLIFTEEEGIHDRLLFHLSDEPTLSQLASYRNAHDMVADILKDQIIADAMSDLKFYEEGLVDHPIFFISHADAVDSQCSNLWLYYTGSTTPRCTNRLISNTSARTRVLGLQLYRYNARGFLHWAYNFYYDRLSAGCYDPKSAPNAYKMLPGVTFLAYPVLGRGTCVVPSIREKLMAEAFDDFRALKLLETRIGREAVLELCERRLGTVSWQTIPEEDALISLREEVNRRIRDTLIGLDSVYIV